MPDEAAAPTRERLLRSGARLFAEQGFRGVSVRDVCRAAETSSNMIHHYFGSKAGLLDAIVEQFSIRVFDVPMRLLATPPKSRGDFQSRIEMLFAATLDVFIVHRDVALVVAREQPDALPLAGYMERFVAFLETGKELGFVRESLDSDMVGGALLDRIANQVRFAPWVKRIYGSDIEDEEYRRRWCASNLDLFFHGMVAPSGATSK